MNVLTRLAPQVQQPAEDKRPLLALVMILKNEAHTITETLKTVKDYVDRYFILDTGSTDGTQDKVREFMQGVPGKIFEEPFIDYGASRNRILELAKETEPCVFTLMLSADEQGAPILAPHTLAWLADPLRSAQPR
jgi:glycosyltransferase involved in cell wall biosynthesis